MVGWLGTFILETWKVIYEASPFFLFGFLAAGALHYWVPAKHIYKLLGQKKFSSIILASNRRDSTPSLFLFRSSNRYRSQKTRSI